MNRNKAVSVILLFSMLVSLLIGSGMTAYGAEASGEDGGASARSAGQSQAAESPADLEVLGTALELGADYEVRLKLQEEQKNYKPGESVLVTVVAERNASAAAISMLDNDILINTKVFKFVTASAIRSSVIEPNYTYEGEEAQADLQRVKILYSSQIAGDNSSPLELEVATLELQVREAAPPTVYHIEQELKGLSAAGQDLTGTVPADRLAITVGDGQEYKLTVVAANASGGAVTGSGSFTEGSQVPILATAAPGYKFFGWTSSGGGEIEDETSPSTVYTMPANEATVTAIFTETKDPTVRLRPEQEKPSWNRGDTITLDLQIEKNGLTGSIRMLDYDLIFDKTAFELTSSSGIQGTVIAEDYTYEGESLPQNRQRVKVLYSNPNSGTSETDPLQVATLQLKVKAAATATTYKLEQAVKGLSIGTQDRAAGTSTVPVNITVQPASKGVTVSGTVELTAGDASKATVVLTKTNISDAQTAYSYEAGTDKDDLIAEITVEEQNSKKASYVFAAVPEGEYTLLIRKPGALYYQRNKLLVAAEEIVYKDITLCVGDIDMDGLVNVNDQNEILASGNYNKSSADAEKPYADMDHDGLINVNDQNEVLSILNYNKAAVVDEN